MKPGMIVMITDEGQHNKKAAEIISLENDNFTVKVCDTGEIIVLKSSNLKRKKLCVCNASKNKPFCDGSHAGLF